MPELSWVIDTWRYELDVHEHDIPVAQYRLISATVNYLEELKKLKGEE